MHPSACKGEDQPEQPSEKEAGSHFDFRRVDLKRLLCVFFLAVPLTCQYSSAQWGGRSDQSTCRSLRAHHLCSIWPEDDIVRDVLSLANHSQSKSHTLTKNEPDADSRARENKYRTFDDRLLSSGALTHMLGTSDVSNCPSSGVRFYRFINNNWQLPQSTCALPTGAADTGSPASLTLR